MITKTWNLPPVTTLTFSLQIKEESIIVTGGILSENSQISFIYYLTKKGCPKYER